MRGVNGCCLRGVGPGIITVANDGNGAAAGSVVTTILSARFGITGARSGFGGRVNIPVAILSVRPGARVLIIRVKVSRFKRLSRLIRLISPSITMVAVVNRTRVRFFGAHSQVTSTGVRVARTLGRSNMLICGNSRPLLVRHTRGLSFRAGAFNAKTGISLRTRGVMDSTRGADFEIGR